MKVLLIYSSIHHGNTEKIARVMGESINADIILLGHMTRGKI